MAVSVANHRQDLPDKVHSVAVVPVTDASRDALTAAWTKVVQEAGTEHSTPVNNFQIVGSCGVSSRRARIPAMHTWLHGQRWC